MFAWVKSGWRGEMRLWKIFWLYGLLLMFVIGGLWFAIMLSLNISYFWAYPFFLVYGVWHVVSLWRCAFNVDWTFFGYLARISSAYSLYSLVSTLLAIIGIGVGMPGPGALATSMATSKPKEMMEIAEECGHEAAAVQFKNHVEERAFNEKCFIRHMAYKAPSYPKCKEIMTEYAKKYNTDPEQYIKQNMDYLIQCVDRYDGSKAPQTPQPSEAH